MSSASAPDDGEEHSDSGDHQRLADRIEIERAQATQPRQLRLGVRREAQRRISAMLDEHGLDNKSADVNRKQSEQTFL